MSDYDFTPFFRSAIGFDQIQDLLSTAMRLGDEPGYPPYNIEKFDDEKYRITMAVAGFTREDLKITVTDEEGQGLLVISCETKAPLENVTYIHKGIASRGFTKRFQLADSVRVVGASMDSGLLHVRLVREVPEKSVGRTIEIETQPDPATQVKMIPSS